MALVRLPFAEAEQRLHGQHRRGGRHQRLAGVDGDLRHTAAVDAVCRNVGGRGHRWCVGSTPTWPSTAPRWTALDRRTRPPRGGSAALARAGSPAVHHRAGRSAVGRARGPDYWVANLRGRVRFAEAVTAAAEDGHRLFLEVSAHPVVSHSIAETLAHLHMRRSERPRRDTGAAPRPTRSARGQHSRWRRCTATARPSRTVSPRRRRGPRPAGHAVAAPPVLAHPDTAARRQRVCTTSRPTRCSAAGRTSPARCPPGVWQTRLDMDTRPYPGDHPVQGTEIVPAAVLLNTFLTAAGAVS